MKQLVQNGKCCRSLTLLPKAAGFTLVELMVSLTVFSIVMLVSVGTLLVMVDANAKAQAMYSATTNLSFALDSMSRDMRTGYHYYCPPSGSRGMAMLADMNFNIADLTEPEYLTPTSCTQRQLVAFTREIDGRDVGYRYNSTNRTIEVSYGDTDSDGDGDWVSLTSPQEVVIETFELHIFDSEPYGEYDNLGNFSSAGLGNTEQPNMDIFVQGYVVNGNGLTSSTTFAIQTHITQRRLDVD